MVICVWGFSGGSAVKNSPAGDTGSIAGKVPWSRAWQPTLVFLLGDSHGQRSLAGYSRWGHRKSRHNLATRKQQSVLYCSYLRCQSASGSDCPWGPSSWSHPLGHLPKVRHPGPGLCLRAWKPKALAPLGSGLRTQETGPKVHLSIKHELEGMRLLPRPMYRSREREDLPRFRCPLPTAAWILCPENPIKGIKIQVIIHFPYNNCVLIFCSNAHRFSRA